MSSSPTTEVCKLESRRDKRVDWFMLAVGSLDEIAVLELGAGASQETG